MATGPDEAQLDTQSMTTTLIVRCIHDGLRKIGETSEKATIYFIETQSGARLQDMPAAPDKLAKALREIFGTGAVFLLEAIVDELDSTRFPDGDVTSAVRNFSRALDLAIRAIESGRM